MSGTSPHAQRDSRRGTPFPEQLALDDRRDDEPANAARSFGAAGTRAHLVEAADGSLLMAIGGMRAEIHAAPHRGSAAVRSDVRLWPFGAERRHEDARGSTVLVERAFAAPEHAVVVLEWEAAYEGELRIDLRIPAGIEVRISGGDTKHAAATIRLHPGEVARLVIASAEDVDVDIDGLINAASARARRRCAHRPVLERTNSAGRTEPDPFPTLDHVLRAAVTRGADFRLMLQDRGTDGVARPLGSADQVRVALALLCLNDRDAARDLLARPDHVPAEWLAALAGAWAAWTADATALGPVIDPVAAWIHAHAPRPADAGSDPATRAALALAPAVVELIGDQELVRAVRGRPAVEPAAALESLGEDASPIALLRASAETMRVMHGALGVAPDAGRGRLRLAPRLGSGSLRLAGLRVGDASFALRATGSTPGRLAVEIEQTGGPVPYRVIMEPAVHVGRLRSAQVDGVPADLETTMEAGGQRVRVRVQLVMDHMRTVVLETE